MFIVRLRGSNFKPWVSSVIWIRSLFLPKKSHLAITERALQKARLEGYDVLILDTAGRLHIDQDLMDEVVAVRNLVKAR